MRTPAWARYFITAWPQARNYGTQKELRGITGQARCGVLGCHQFIRTGLTRKECTMNVLDLILFYLVEFVAFFLAGFGFYYDPTDNQPPLLAD